MRIVLFYHSLVSDWNHGNAHFLRGIAAELIARGHDLRIYEPSDSWSLQNLLAEHGDAPFKAFRAAYPTLRSMKYDPQMIDLHEALDGADLVIVHEWNSHLLVRRIGEHRNSVGHYTLLFHDTHHRVVTDPESMSSYDLSHYDGVLAFGESLRQQYLKLGLANRVWTWHEAADARLFRPTQASAAEGDLVWIGNWGDEERSGELIEFLVEPVRDLGLKSRAYGVRYPGAGLEALRSAGIQYGGWIPNYAVPETYARFALTLHIPRRPYVRALPGIPTIRVFEALACGIPLICAPWDDSEGLFAPGEDFLVAANGAEMKREITALLSDKQLRAELRRRGLRTIAERHTCSHRVDELLNIYRGLADLPASFSAVAAPSRVA